MLCNPLHLARKVVGQAFPLDSLTAAKKSKKRREDARPYAY